MGRAIEVDNRIQILQDKNDDLDRRLKLVEDALEELLEDVDLPEDTSDMVADGIEVGKDETFTPPVGKSKKTKTKKPEVVESLL